MPDDAQERTEEATPRKRQKARRKGTVARSTDLTNALVMLGLVALLPSIVSGIGKAFELIVRAGMANIPSEVGFASVSGYTVGLLVPCLLAVLPLVAVAMVVGLAGNLAQVGFVVSSETLQPSWSKINPLEGMKRLVSRDSLFETGKTTAKALVFCYVAYTAVAANWDVVLGLSSSTPQGAVVGIGRVAHAIVLRVSIAWIVVAIADYIYQRKKVDKMLRMSKQELKQEFREMEQAPELKAAMNQRRRKFARMRVAEAMKTADVVVTNPTHFSVALKYDKGKMHAPMVVAKGQDLLAFKIRQLAAENRVPIVPNPLLARQLYAKCEIGDFVPRELFQAVAEVLAYVYRSLKDLRN